MDLQCSALRRRVPFRSNRQRLTRRRRRSSISERGKRHQLRIKATERGAATAASVKKVAFQGKPGAYSELACIEVFPHLQRNPCELFDDTFQAMTAAKDFSL